MKAIKRTAPVSAKTSIDLITVLATASFKRHSIAMTRQFPATLTIADADIQFKEWANTIAKAYPTAPVSIEIKFGNDVWSY